jgi:hypothetical protein
MNKEGFWRHAMMAALALSLAAAGCSTYNYVATSGSQITGDTAFEHKPAAWIITESARHDLRCPSAAIVLDGSLKDDWMVEGCGMRITYRFVTTKSDWNAVVVARVAMCDHPEMISANEQCAAPLPHSSRE